MTESKKLWQVKNGEIFKFARLSHVLEHSTKGFERLHSSIYNLDTGREFYLNAKKGYSHMNTCNSRKVILLSEGPGPYTSIFNEKSKGSLEIAEKLITVLEDSNAFLDKEFKTRYVFDSRSPYLSVYIKDCELLRLSPHKVNIHRIGYLNYDSTTVYDEEFFIPVVRLIQMSINKYVCS